MVCELGPATGAITDPRKLGTRYPMIPFVPQSGTEHLLIDRGRAWGVDIEAASPRVERGLQHRPGAV